MKHSKACFKQQSTKVKLQNKSLVLWTNLKEPIYTKILKTLDSLEDKRLGAVWMDAPSWRSSKEGAASRCFFLSTPYAQISGWVGNKEDPKTLWTINKSCGMDSPWSSYWSS